MTRLSSFQWRTTGWLRTREGLFLPRGSVWKRLEVPVGFGFLIHPDEGPILVDTGMAPRARAALGWLARPLSLFLAWREGPTAAEQLTEQGMDPKSIEWIFLTHFDYDHTAGLLDFPNARIVTLPNVAPVLASDHMLGLLRYRSLTGSLLPRDLDRRLATPQKLGVRQVSDPIDGWDIFGDGSLLVVELPGHAPGHLGILARTDLGDVFFLGDAVWSTDALTGPTDARAHRMLAWNRQECERTRRRLAEWAHAHPDVTLLPTHCRDAFTRVGKAT